MISQARTLVVAVVVAWTLTGCTAQRKLAIFLESGFQPGSITEITLLPTIDARIDKGTEVDLEQQIRAASAEILRDRGYSVVLGTAGAPLAEEDLESVDSATIKALGQSGARWVLAVSLIDVTSKITFGSTGNAEVAGYLFNTENGALAWRDKGIGQVGQGGLLGMALVATMDDAAISAALHQLFASIPERGE